MYEGGVGWDGVWWCGVQGGGVNWMSVNCVCVAINKIYICTVKHNV